MQTQEKYPARMVWILRMGSRHGDRVVERIGELIRMVSLLTSCPVSLIATEENWKSSLFEEKGRPRLVSRKMNV